MAKLLGVSRSGYYRYCRHEPSRRQRENEVLSRAIGQIFRDSRETYGSPRIHAELIAQG